SPSRVSRRCTRRLCCGCARGCRRSPSTTDARRSEHLFAGVPVGDIDRARTFYEQLLGRPADLIPNDREAAWQVHAGAWIVLIAGETTLGATQHTLLVADLAAFLE